VVRPLAPAAAVKQPDIIKTVLNEKLLKIILVLDVMRTLPPKTAGMQKI
jgi:hypothetical protein